MKEIQKVIVALAIAGIPYEVINQYGFNCPQVWYPSQQNPVCDIICNPISMGYKYDLLEMQGLAISEDGCDGYLSAETVVERIKKHYYANYEQR